MKKNEDFINKKFNRWTILSFSHKDKWGEKVFNCKCDCGTERTVPIRRIINGRSKSCGCITKENNRLRCATHNLTKNSLYRVWACMKTRCYNPNCTSYKYYGMKGICICDEWKNDFMNFYNWAIENGYKKNDKKKLTIDRIDFNGNYEPNNCRFVEMSVQSRNTAKNVYVVYNGERKVISDWADYFGYKRDRFLYMYRELKDMDKVLEYFKQRGNHIRYDKSSCRLVEFNGEVDTLRNFADKQNIPYKRVSQRIKKLKWSIEKALSTPIQQNHQIEYNGQVLEFNTIARMNNINIQSLKYQWKKNNYDIYKAVEHFKGEEWKKNLSKA